MPSKYGFDDEVDEERLRKRQQAILDVYERIDDVVYDILTDYLNSSWMKDEYKVTKKTWYGDYSWSIEHSSDVFRTHLRVNLTFNEHDDPYLENSDPYLTVFVDMGDDSKKKKLLEILHRHTGLKVERKYNL